MKTSLIKAIVLAGGLLLVSPILADTSKVNTIEYTSTDTSSNNNTKTSTCEEVSDFQATNRITYNCKTGQSFSISAAKMGQCKSGGVAAEDKTVNSNVYSLFCEDGSSISALCLNGNFNIPTGSTVKNDTPTVITCEHNS